MINLKETVPSEAILIQVDKMFCIDGYIVFCFCLSSAQVDLSISQTHRITNQNGSRLLIHWFYVVQFYTVLCCISVLLYDFL